MIHAIILGIDYQFVAIQPEIKINSPQVTDYITFANSWLWGIGNDQAFIQFKQPICNGISIIVASLMIFIIFDRKKSYFQCIIYLPRIILGIMGALLLLNQEFLCILASLMTIGFFIIILWFISDDN